MRYKTYYSTAILISVGNIFYLSSSRVLRPMRHHLVNLLFFFCILLIDVKGLWSVSTTNGWDIKPIILLLSLYQLVTPFVYLRHVAYAQCVIFYVLAIVDDPFMFLFFLFLIGYFHFCNNNPHLVNFLFWFYILLVNVRELWSVSTTNG
jgi:hypothetical protein